MIQELSRWENYYVIVGSSAGALTGLQFVVITLIAQLGRGSGTMRQIAAYGTPTVVHFCAVLLISAIISAPWGSISGIAEMLAAVGLAGIVYAIVVTRRAQMQEGYRPVLSDWVWHTALPLLGYAAILFAAVGLGGNAGASLFVIGAASLLLLFIGIHNSWDTVTYVAIVRPALPADDGSERESGPDSSRATGPAPEPPDTARR